MFKYLYLIGMTAILGLSIAIWTIEGASVGYWKILCSFYCVLWLQQWNMTRDAEKRNDLQRELLGDLCGLMSDTFRVMAARKEPEETVDA